MVNKSKICYNIKVKFNNFIHAGSLKKASWFLALYMSQEIQTIKEKITPILKQAGVLRSSIFGSVARGEADENSDVDILVDLPRGTSLFDLVDLRNNLQLTLGKKVDIGTYRSIRSVLKERILKEQVPIYER